MSSTAQHLLAAFLIFALVLSLAACKPAAPPSTQPGTGEHGPGPGPDPLAHLVLTSRPHNLGTAEVNYPAPEKLLDLPDSGGKTPANHVWQLMADGLGRPDAEAIASSWGARVIGEIAFVGLYQIETSDKTVEQLEARLKQAAALTGVAAALPNAALPTRVDALTGPAVEQCNPTANANYLGAHARPHQMIGLRDAWAMIDAAGLKLSPVQIGVIDHAAWGASPEFNHDGGPSVLGLQKEDIEGQAVGDDVGGHSHGTEIVHTIGADHRVGGVIGVASILGDKLSITMTDMWERAVTRPEGRADPNDPRSVTVDGVTFWCDHLIRLMHQVEAGSTVISCSFGPKQPEDPDSLEAKVIRAIHAAYTRFAQHLAAKYPNVLLLGSAGNDDIAINETNRYFGQRLGNVMTIGALDLDGQKASFSNYMAPRSDLEVSLAAPGVGIVTSVGSDGASITADGTSFSTPVVAGAAAILRSIKPDLSAEQVKSILVETAATAVRSQDDRRDVPVTASVSGRILRVDNAVLRVINMVRRESGLPELTREQLLGLGGFSIAVSGGPSEYLVKASVPGVAPVGTQLTLAVLEGQARLTTQATVKLTAPGDAGWTVVRGSEGQAAGRDTLVLKVTRVESGACAKITIPYAEVNRDLEDILASDLIYIELGGRVYGLKTSGGKVTEAWDNIGAGVDIGHRYLPPQLGDWTLETSGFTWSGLSLDASYHLSKAVAMSLKVSVRLALAADGQSIEWLEFGLEHQNSDRQMWREEWRIENVLLEGRKSRVWASSTPPRQETVLGGVATSNHADVGKYLTRYYRYWETRYAESYEYDMSKATTRFENLRLRVMFLQAR